MTTLEKSEFLSKLDSGFEARIFKLRSQIQESITTLTNDHLEFIKNIPPEILSLKLSEFLDLEIVENDQPWIKLFMDNNDLKRKGDDLEHQQTSKKLATDQNKPSQIPRLTPSRPKPTSNLFSPSNAIPSSPLSRPPNNQLFSPSPSRIPRTPGGTKVKPLTRVLVNSVAAKYNFNPASSPVPANSKKNTGSEFMNRLNDVGKEIELAEKNVQKKLGTVGQFDIQVDWQDDDVVARSKQGRDDEDMDIDATPKNPAKRGPLYSATPTQRFVFYPPGSSAVTPTPQNGPAMITETPSLAIPIKSQKTGENILFDLGDLGSILGVLNSEVGEADKEKLRESIRRLRDHVDDVLELIDKK
ncbi:hypothetical protein HK098_004317 [Nowakowskiella sp. JEL0407]|nr:hypothetical protein HK098_004317 [Nowakowskiella sp. JEL0407]